MNGIDPVVVATGNDWRAVEAGAHAWAARKGRYTSLTRWERDMQGNLVGSMELPMPVGLIGGATRIHPVASAALKLMRVESANELSQVIAAVGLAQNMAALRALSTEGIQRGHMALHARNIAVGAGAAGDEIDQIAMNLVAEGEIIPDAAMKLLAKIRSEKKEQKMKKQLVSVYNPKEQAFQKYSPQADFIIKMPVNKKLEYRQYQIETE